MIRGSFQARSWQFNYCRTSLVDQRSDHCCTFRLGRFCMFVVPVSMNVPQKFTRTGNTTLSSVKRSLFDKALALGLTAPKTSEE